MYAMLGTRPDIVYVVGAVSQFLANPNKLHWVAVKQIFWYLKGILNYSLIYSSLGNGSSGISGLGIHSFMDANWGVGYDRKSVGGFIFLMDGVAISWSSKKQSTVALSSTEAEYMALTQGVKEGLWLSRLAQELGTTETQRPTIYSDNQGALALSQNPQHHATSKHIDIQYHFVREHAGITVNLEYISTEQNTADILTKALGRIKHQVFCEGIGLKAMV